MHFSSSFKVNATIITKILMKLNQKEEEFLILNWIFAKPFKAPQAQLKLKINPIFAIICPYET
ncbi:hypothetical protein HMPREF9388_0986 [Streptococcus sanguinis SK353]|uniref:Uncharacterized protein n=1 Tax=Streptococcus sanguinis SK353 TaxID=888815 RepID=F0FE54_STRSA|nr:hypothetical protein HMPREF9388_0986 [Streptococcus sanguinis SK353]